MRRLVLNRVASSDKCMVFVWRQSLWKEMADFAMFSSCKSGRLVLVAPGFCLLLGFRFLLRLLFDRFFTF